MHARAYDSAATAAAPQRRRRNATSPPRAAKTNGSIAERSGPFGEVDQAARAAEQRRARPVVQGSHLPRPVGRQLVTKAGDGRPLFFFSSARAHKQETRPPIVDRHLAGGL